jgi:hypothetical protein
MHPFHWRKIKKVIWVFGPAPSWILKFIWTQKTYKLYAGHFLLTINVYIFSIADPGSQTPYNFLGKKFYNSLKIGPIFFLWHLKHKIILNFMKFVATKKGMTAIFLTPLFCCGFWILDPGWVKIRDP